MTRMINNAGLDIIKQAEGLKLVPYKDINGFDTIGYGHRMLPSDSIPPIITQDEAIGLLMQDLGIAEDAISNLVEASLTDNQFSALVSFVYNIGQGKFGGSTMCRLLNEGDYDNAALEFPKWCHDSQGNVVQGLLDRRIAEQTLFNT